MREIVEVCGNRLWLPFVSAVFAAGCVFNVYITFRRDYKERERALNAAYFAIRMMIAAVAAITYSCAYALDAGHDIRFGVVVSGVLFLWLMKIVDRLPISVISE